MILFMMFTINNNKKKQQKKESNETHSSTPNETADTAHMGSFASDTRPLSRFLDGAWGQG